MFFTWDDPELLEVKYDIPTKQEGAMLSLLKCKEKNVFKKKNLKYKELGPRMVSRVNYYLLKFTFFWRIKDFQFVQFYPARYIKNVPIISRSSLIPCELLTRSRRYGYRLHQVPLHYHSARHDRQSKCMNLKNIFFTLRDLIKLRLSLIGADSRSDLSAPSPAAAPVTSRIENPGSEDPVLG